MKKLLYVCPAGQTEERKFADILASALPEFEIKVSDAGFTTLLFELKKYDLAHFFTKVPRKRSTPCVHTITSAAEAQNNYGDVVVTFCDSDHELIPKGSRVETIYPCVPKSASIAAEAPSEIRAKYGVDDRLLVVALSDFSDHDHFSAFLYAAREYQRRDGFRFLLPLYRQDKETLTWRDSLRKIVEQEKLTLTSFIEPSVDYHSLVDAADFCIHVSKARKQTFEFPLNVAEAMCAGKPVICFNTPPLNEFIAGFKKEWIAHTNEDYSRISRDLAKQSLNLEQISTEFARYARPKLSVEAVSARYREIYNSLLGK